MPATSLISLPRSCEEQEGCEGDARNDHVVRPNMVGEEVRKEATKDTPRIQYRKLFTDQ